MYKTRKDLSPAEQLADCTVRLECKLNSGDAATGTGFFFKFRRGDQYISTIVTNRHVVDDANLGTFLLTASNPSGGPDVGKTIPARLDNFEARWTGHPDPHVDLCAMPISAIISEATSFGPRPFYTALNEELIPTDKDIESLDVSETITMIGYPSGLWDRVNNMPIFRRGTSATHPALDLNGRREFMIDAACFPGSSGSPVFLLDIGGYIEKNRGAILGPDRIKLLGVLYAGPQFSAEGDIEVIPVPTSTSQISVTQIPMNLGIIIKASELGELGKQVWDAAGTAAP